MWIRLARGLINLDKVDTVRAVILHEQPAIEFSIGEKTVSMIAADFPSAERMVDDIEHALRGGAHFFDLR